MPVNNSRPWPWRLLSAPLLLLGALAMTACTVEAGGTGSAASPGTSNLAAQEKLTRAIELDDAAAVRAALKEGAGLESKGEKGATPLVAATKANKSRAAVALLEAGADPDAKDELQDSAFLYAGAEGLDTILEATLKHGADVKSTNRYGGTALIPASEHAHVSTVRILLKAGVPVDHVNQLGWTALLEAIVLGDGDADHVTTVRLLLEAGADPAKADADGATPRQLAQRAGQTRVVELLDRALRASSK
ncbi:ankyrin repeat domain-containing protein [Galactobacter caseinivorans]|uniref:Ankyrin repeat domain-containing protein n=1 Tax=Galactobacter caseinivorans TaxID=2676123 RepID=A0A496PHZ9_9MICC|nr:ankyrin repeat domain-containing protein [Galactobacter caseinivorans]RKW70111.1 ankyrin repeat domain-containing protein [Galactobacter caseinivorans]